MPTANQPVRSHSSDADCDGHLDADNNCQICRVYHGAPCPSCDGCGYHAATCQYLIDEQHGMSGVLVMLPTADVQSRTAALRAEAEQARETNRVMLAAADAIERLTDEKTAQRAAIRDLLDVIDGLRADATHRDMAAAERAIRRRYLAGA